MAEVTGVDKGTRTISILKGTRRFPQVIEYDHLISAVGQKTDLSQPPGLAAHSFCVRDLADALGKSSDKLSASSLHTGSTRSAGQL